MAQGIRRPGRHSRQPSRIATLLNRGGTEYEPRTLTQPERARDAATVDYIKRALCAKPKLSGSPPDSATDDIDSRSLEELLPPLTSSDEIDVHLYALIAVIINQFIQSWYNRTTPDRDFVGDIVQIIAHCTRGLEQRLRSTDLERLILDELPALLDAHMDAVATACDATHSSSERDSRLLYHRLRPHPALTPLPVNPAAIREQHENEVCWCQMLVNSILPLVLPPEDLENPCLRVFVSEVFAETILRNGICGKGCECWLLWEGVTKLVNALRPDTIPTSTSGKTTLPINRLEQFGLSASLDAAANPPQPKFVRRSIDAIASVFWSTLQFSMCASMLLRAFATAVWQAQALPPRSSQSYLGRTIGVSDSFRVVEESNQLHPASDNDQLKPLESIPIVGMSVWGCVSRLISLSQRMPWLTGLLSLLQWLSLFGPGQVCSTNSRLDRLLSYHIHEKVLNAAVLPPVLQAIRSAIFPDYAIAPMRVPPTSDQVNAIKRECARTIVEAIPQRINLVFFATQDQALIRQDVESALELFADPYINKHLVIAAVELIVVRLFPELAHGETEGG